MNKLVAESDRDRFHAWLGCESAVGGLGSGIGMAGPDLDSKNESKRRRRSSCMPMSEGSSPRKRRKARSTRALRCSPLMRWWQSSQAAQELTDSKVTGGGVRSGSVGLHRSWGGFDVRIWPASRKVSQGYCCVGDGEEQKSQMSTGIENPYIEGCRHRVIWSETSGMGSGGWCYSARSCWQRRDPLGWR